MVGEPLHLVTPKANSTQLQGVKDAIDNWAASWFCSKAISIRHGFGCSVPSTDLSESKSVTRFCFIQGTLKVWLEYDDAALARALLDTDHMGESHQLHSAYTKLVMSSGDDLIEQLIPKATRSYMANSPFLLDKYVFYVESSNKTVARLIVPAQWLGLAAAINVTKPGGKLSRDVCLEPMLEHSDVAVEVFMPLEPVTLGELMELSPGDVIQSPRKVTDKFQVKVNGRHLTDCYLGKNKQNKAILF